MSSTPIPLAHIRHLIVDMDGVLWRGPQVMPGLQDFFAVVRAHSLRFVLATNNATKPARAYVDRLAELGVSIREDEVITSPQATAAFLAAQSPGARIFVIGERGLIEALESAGLRVVNDTPETATHVVVGLDRGLSYTKLAEACLLIRRGAAFIGTNPDLTFPSERGLTPGNGAILAALQAATGVAPLVIGKPEPEMFRQALRRLGGTLSDTAVIGDRLDTDVLGGQRLGLTTILVLSGVTTEHEAQHSSIRPDYTFEHIGAVAEALRRALS
ncbi:MAG: HAD-IIA family hydrolase [Thermoflexales bacterium]|nr:HAD-IIA family hydrolase [Thermoflexales bacterium]